MSIFPVLGHSASYTSDPLLASLNNGTPRKGTWLAMKSGDHRLRERGEKLVSLVAGNQGAGCWRSNRGQFLQGAIPRLDYLTCGAAKKQRTFTIRVAFQH